MDAVVPIIGYEAIATNLLLQQRIEFLIENMGYRTEWIDLASVILLHKSTPVSLRIPFIINITAQETSAEHRDLLSPLFERFKTALCLSKSVEKVPNALFLLQDSLSFWEGPPPSQTIRDTIKYIYANLANPELCIHDLCTIAHSSKDRLESLFRQWKRCSIWKYVIYLRLREAQRLLLELDDPIYAIGLSVGYDDLSSFDRVFHKHVGESPKAFRQKVNYYRQKVNTTLAFSQPEERSYSISLHIT